MKAVNLIPESSRGSRARTAASGGASSGAYALLGGLAVLVAAAAAWTVTDKQVSDRKADVQRLEVQAQAAETAAAAAEPYKVFSQLAKDRTATVKSLAGTRFDWANAMREVSRVLPNDVWLTTMTGTSGATDAAPSPTTSAAPAPTFKLQGCTRSQKQVAGLLGRLRAINGVRTVQLVSSEKNESSVTPAAGASSGGSATPAASASGGDCPANRENDPKFEMDIAFAVPGGAAAQSAAPGAAPAAPGAAPAAPGAAPAPADPKNPAASTPAPAPAAASTTTPSGGSNDPS